MYIEKRGKKRYIVYDFLGCRKKFFVSDAVCDKKMIQHMAQEVVSRVSRTDGYLAYSKQIKKEEKLEKMLHRLLITDIYMQLETLEIETSSGVQQTIKTMQTYYEEQYVYDFVHHSNFIEGSRIPYEEVKKVMEEGSSTYQVLQEIREVQNSKKVRDYIQKDFRFTDVHIKRLYHKLTDGLFMDTGKPYPRGYKKVNNVAGEQSTVSREQVPEAMAGLLQWFKEQKKQMFPLQLAFEFHYRFERIHPFRDGNGRVGRFLMNKILLSKGFPPMIIFGDNRRAYFNAIKKGGETMKKYYSFMNKQYMKSLALVQASY